MVPASDGGNDPVGIGGPDEGLGVMVGLVEVAVDGGLEVDDGAEDAALEASLGQRRAKKVSTALSQEHEVGVKWKVKRGWRPSQAITFGCLWAA